MKYCSNCGAQVEANSSFCQSCGANLNGGNNYQQNNYQNSPIVSKRDLVACILLSLFTCGIYGLIWFAGMTDDSNRVSNSNDPSGAMSILLVIITCGFYSIYWYYRMGQKLYIAGQTHNKDISDNSIVYLILGIFGLGMVAQCLMQNDLNKFAN